MSNSAVPNSASVSSLLSSAQSELHEFHWKQQYDSQTEECKQLQDTCHDLKRRLAEAEARHHEAQRLADQSLDDMERKYRYWGVRHDVWTTVLLALDGT